MTENTLAAFRHHGGRLSAAQTMFPSAPSPWIDLSTGISPYPWPGARADDLSALPDPDDIADLEKAAATYFGCPDQPIAALPGADMGLRLLPHILKARSVAIVSPTYQGHAEAWRDAGADMNLISRNALASVDAQVVVVVNPNNPDGEIITPSDLLALLQRQQTRSGWLVVDESFADIMPEISVAAHAQRGLIVLRSFGKFFGLPGARLGFAIGDSAVIRAIRSVTGAWPVNADALHLGKGAYSDTSWHQNTRVRLKADAERLDSLLMDSGFAVCGGTSLFRLVSCADAEKVFLGLAAKGILVRPFDYASNWLRFGIPRAGQWTRVADALRECRQ